VRKIAFAIAAATLLLFASPSGSLMPRQGLARSVLPERLRITLRSILWPAASMRFAGRATPWCAGCSTAGAPVVAVFIAET
jgi:hypothetical protein